MIESQETPNPSPPGGRDVVMSFAKTTLLSIPIGLLVVCLSVLPYLAFWGAAAFSSGIRNFFSLWSLIPALIIGVLLHEAIHGLTWAWAGRRPLSAIRFGFNLAAFTPYAHLSGTIPALAYKFGAAMPGIVLGVVPVALSWMLGDGWMLWFGTFFFAAAAGDMMILWMIRGVRSDASVQDHPSLPGCIVYDHTKGAPTADPSR